MFRYLIGAAVTPGGWKYRLARDLAVGKPQHSAPSQPHQERRPAVPNHNTPHIHATWTRRKETSVVRGHANEIYPGNRVTVHSIKPGWDGSRLSLKTIGEVEDDGRDEYTGEPMRIGWPVR